jgi:SOS-response transcriptional repressor LexA
MKYRSNPDPNVLTPKQKRALDVVTEHFNRTGTCPTMVQLGEALNVSKVTAYEHVCALRRKGLLSTSGKWARSMRPLDTPAMRLAKLVKLKYVADAEAVALAEQVLAA